jgi:Flp pilus assembly protein TadD
VLLALTGSAFADDNQQKADRYFAEGRELLTKHQDAKGACEKFELAIQLDPTAPGVMLNLGLCYEMQGKFANAGGASRCASPSRAPVRS